MNELHRDGLGDVPPVEAGAEAGGVVVDGDYGLTSLVTQVAYSSRVKFYELWALGLGRMTRGIEGGPLMIVDPAKCCGWQSRCENKRQRQRVD